MKPIRPQAFAGSFYPEDEEELKKSIKSYLSDAKVSEIKGEIRAIISPHAGYPYSAPVAASAFKLIQKSNFREIVIIGTSHKMMFSGMALSNFGFWQTPLGTVPSSSLFKKLEEDFNFQLLNEAHVFEHSIEVQLPFLQSVMKDFYITPIATGRINDHKEIAEKISKFINKDTLIIASADFSHYLPYKEAQKIDKKTIKKIINLKTNINHEESCGANGIIILVELAKLLKWKAKLLDYRNSGDTEGEKNEVVGYASIVFYKE